MIFDLPLDQLEHYAPARTEPDDFDRFWTKTLLEACAFPLNPRFEYVQSGLRFVDVFDVTFSGFGGQPIRGWLLIPKEHDGALPCVVEFVGYGGGRGYPLDWLMWSSHGYAHLIMDTRGQGSVWSKGDTPDPDGSSPQVPGFMTRGILRPESYYYRRVFTDAVRAVETARSHPAIDGEKVVVAGGSQGGGIAIAVSSLVPNIAGAMPDVPFLCHMRVATELVDTHPYQEIAQFCRIHRERVDQIFKTLSYFDGVNHAARAKCRALFSAGLMDDVCPPRTVFAAFNHYAGPKEIRVYPYNRHEGGQTEHVARKARFLEGIC